MMRPARRKLVPTAQPLTTPPPRSSLLPGGSASGAALSILLVWILVLLWGLAGLCDASSCAYVSSFAPLPAPPAEKVHSQSTTRKETRIHFFVHSSSRVPNDHHGSSTRLRSSCPFACGHQGTAPIGIRHTRNPEHKRTMERPTDWNPTTTLRTTNLRSCWKQLRDFSSCCSTTCSPLFLPRYYSMTSCTTSRVLLPEVRLQWLWRKEFQ